MATERPSSATRRRLARFGWLLAIWAASVLALGAFAWLLRQVMNAVGLSA
jgi:hypothetical protein